LQDKQEELNKLEKEYPKSVATLKSERIKFDKAIEVLPEKWRELISVPQVRDMVPLSGFVETTPPKTLGVSAAAIANIIKVFGDKTEAQLKKASEKPRVKSWLGNQIVVKNENGNYSLGR